MNLIGIKTQEEVRTNPHPVPRSPIVALKARNPLQEDYRGSLQVDVNNALRSTCPSCGTTTDKPGMALNLSIGPIEEGIQVIFVRPGASMQTVTDQVKRTLLSDALRRARGNHAEAARLVGMKYSTFYALVKRLLSRELLESF